MGGRLRLIDCHRRGEIDRSEMATSRRSLLTSVGAACSGLAGCAAVENYWSSPGDSPAREDTAHDGGPTNDTDHATGGAGRESPDDDDGPQQLVIWNRQLLDVIRFVSETPPGVTRHLGIFSVATYDAITTISIARGDPAYEPYNSYRATAPETASRIAALGGAAHEVLSRMYPTFTEQFDKTLARTFERANNLEGDVSTGEEWGRSVATKVIDARANDGHDEVEADGYRPCEDPAETPGCWRGGNINTWRHSHFAFLDPWVISDPLTVGEPPALTSDIYADSWHDVYELGEHGPEQPQEHTDIATFWRGGAGTTRPSGRWFRIANIATEAFEPSLLESARVFALVALGLGDAGVTTWHAKHRHGFWRPAAAIHHADTDGNPSTVADPDWTPVAVGGGPEYPSALACYGSVAKTILEEVFETDSFSFEMRSRGPPEHTRSFESLADAFDESCRSRRYIGNHFRFSLDDAIEPGEEIADSVLASLPPVN